ncbi:MauE/DoxX family redox-associated membrane protein [Pseudonocardia acaciae]|uniref:MauE/DoxX family redox-associated membrane protein n=1 Tax=Pseudonocardia acaciae TaxID=551276 RepID=UPI000684942B|nr:MauE/DoxX family redox-associated membrane protein [Pseudonocardia acaciae]
MGYVVIGCRCLVGLGFALAAASKLRNRAAFDQFVGAVRAVFPRLSGRHGVVAAALVAATEAAVPVLLVAPGTAPAGVALACLALLGFTAAVVTALRRGSTVPCRCFGGSSAPLGRHHLVRNGVLLAAAALAAIAPRDAGELAGIAVAVGAGASAALLVARFDELVDLLLPHRIEIEKGSL